MTYFTPTHVEKYFLSSEDTPSLSSSIKSSSIESKKIIASVGVDHVTPSSVNLQCRRGIDYLLTHLEEPLFPRDIMTKKLGHKIEVFYKESILSHFEESNYQDCRISAYPRLTNYNGINLIAPSFVMIDLDLGLGTELSLTKVLKTTLNRIYQSLQTSPTVLWTGNGYHVYLPIKAFVLEEEEVFAKFQDGKTYGPSLSTKFIRFSEAFFTNEKHDSQHRPSVNSCLLRVPGSFNSKNGQPISVIQQWDGKKTAIQYMLRNFRRYLIQEKLDEVNDRKKKCETSNDTSSSHTIRWIEFLLQTPIRDYRKYCLWRILTPYLVNVRKLSDEESVSVIGRWLNNCNSIKGLSFDPKSLLKYNLRNARRFGYYPISWNILKRENLFLYRLLNFEEASP